jgi:outer membrane protein OmpA-like peptidoglycan-associated protein
MAHFVGLGGSWQAREIGTGGVAAGAVELAASPRFGVEGRLLFGRFLQGDSPADPALRKVEAAGMFGLGLGFRLHPFFDHRGPWIGGAVGGVRTGALSRATFDARIGWDFRLADGFRAGPFLGYMHVLQPDDSRRPEDARLALFGLHGAFYSEPFRAPRPVESVPAPEPKVVRCGTDECAEPVRSHALLVPDRCPGEPDDFIGASDADGCPTNAEVKVLGDEIVLNDRVYFDFGHTHVDHRSWPVLKSLAKMILAHPEYVVVHIDGHCDEIGDDQWNQVISEERAAAVRKKLVAFGVPESRLVSQGFGKTSPRANGKDEASRQQNRRVEFHIERKITMKAGTP